RLSFGSQGKLPGGPAGRSRAGTAAAGRGTVQRSGSADAARTPDWRRGSRPRPGVPVARAVAVGLAAVGRVAERRKGGSLAVGTRGAELMDLLAEGVVAEAEAFGDVLLASAIDEDGAERLVETLRVVCGLEEEKATSGIVHGGIPE